MTKDSAAPVTLVSVFSEAEAAAIVALLAESGIEARAAGGTTAGFRAEAPGNVEVLVHQEDLERARKILAEARRENAAIDWNQVDVDGPQ